MIQLQEGLKELIKVGHRYYSRPGISHYITFYHVSKDMLVKDYNCQHERVNVSVILVPVWLFDLFAYAEATEDALGMIYLAREGERIGILPNGLGKQKPLREVYINHPDGNWHWEWQECEPYDFPYGSETYKEI